MKKSLTINAIRNGKKVSKSLGYINPDAANSIVGGFAQMVNALSNDTFVNAEVVKKMDTSEEEQQSGGSTPTPAKQEGRILFDYNSATGEGNTYTECDTSDVLPFYSKRLSSSFISRLYKYL